MPTIYADNALTAGQIRKALRGVPDDALVGTSIFDIVGHVTKVDRVLYDKITNIVTLDADKHNGTFTEDEMDSKAFQAIAELEG